MINFHAHIYFENKNLYQAHKLKELATSEIFFDSCRIYEKPVGPHPYGMIELHFNAFNYNNAIKWIKNHRNSYSVLIHQVTGDDIVDHTNEVLWLGEVLPLDFKFFELIKHHPDLQIHHKKI